MSSPSRLLILKLLLPYLYLSLSLPLLPLKVADSVDTFAFEYVSGNHKQQQQFDSFSLFFTSRLALRLPAVCYFAGHFTAQRRQLTMPSSVTVVCL